MAVKLKGTVEDQKSVSGGKYLISSVLIEGERYPLDIFEKDTTLVRAKGATVSVVLEVSRKTGKFNASIA